MKTFTLFYFLISFVSSVPLLAQSDDTNDKAREIFLIPQTGFSDKAGNQVNLVSSKWSLNRGSQGIINYIHGGAPRSGVVTGYVSFACVTTADTLVQNQLGITVTSGVNRKTKFEFDIETGAPAFKLSGYYVLPGDTTHYPISTSTFTGTIMSLTLPPSATGIYYLQLDGYSTSTTAGYVLYSVRAKQ